MNTQTKLAPLRNLNIQTHGTKHVEGRLCYLIAESDVLRLPTGFRYVSKGRNYAYIVHESDDRFIELQPATPNDATAYFHSDTPDVYYAFGDDKGSQVAIETHLTEHYPVKGKPRRPVIWAKLLEEQKLGRVHFLKVVG